MNIEEVRLNYARWEKRLRPILRFLFPTKVYGMENFVDQPCLICINHSNFYDPLLIALAFGGHRVIHFMAKAELFRNKRFGALLESVGAFGVDRDGADISAVRTVMKYIRNGEIVGIFPEGTRVDTDGAVEAKAGAVRMAAKLRVPIVPVYLSRKKRLFRTSKIVIGEALYVPADAVDYRAATNDLMNRISELGRSVI